MDKISLCLLILVLSIFSVKGALGSSTSRLHPRTMTFLESQCKRTRYPELCVRSLSNLVNTTSQNPQILSQVALKVSLVKAVSTKYYIMKVCKEFNQINKVKNNQAAKDCLDQISDGVSHLTNSVKELQHLSLDGERAFIWHQSNVQTWLSTVLTDAYTCMEGMNNSGYAAMGGNVKAMIKAKVLNVAQLTSNALALFNGFAARHKASHHGKHKP
ncbi:hypothetical protein K7X08_016502 [Anisodus acutangulus]|uniref:Pectinesterase inhibitor domain-containing protein n=1 Tax=Anisodus acutangulus TaxID=402998 RepID=A0A9Q1LDU0_9SOLA|nr:hypothetical protein K7X08_016502 [Anisodus acutangulus]